MESTNVFEGYRGKPLSGRALLGLADIAFFDMFSVDTDLALLGYRIDVPKLKACMEKLDQLEERSTAEVQKLIQADFRMFAGELPVITGAIRGLYNFFFQGLKKSGDLGTSQIVDHLYIIFACSYLHAGTADPVFNWLLAQKWGPLVENTISYHLTTYRERPPLIYPEGTQIRNYLLRRLVDDPNAQLNPRKK